MHTLSLEEIEGEGLSKEKILIRIGATDKQIKLMEKVISEAPKQKNQMSPQIYEAMVEGYNGILEHLKTELGNYNEVLKRK
ncbi:MAG: hypothetical protein PHH54_04670 [Candidatus Nanoarchaeia archaeon]|nr:hypothetical protein [Candidatus Nanoarchaeia archaeon]MDD5741250.1 hypothetical protein [Candidatus Nanoarchaeia archaeon]